jgi:phospholipid/cholesterol/gamma-HCH transport system substrate-binding protein
MSTFVAGLLGIIAIIAISYLAYTKFANPFSTQYTVQAVFSNANGVGPDSLVRIAGINVGKVTGVSTAPGCTNRPSAISNCQAASVTMQIDDMGLPLHKDATFAIRPRIFLEGNFFVDVRPGSPSAPTVPNGYTFPIQQGTEPVQLDQVLTSLQAGTRRNLQILLKEYGTAVKQAGPSYNNSIQFWLPAYQYSAIVAHDALGIQPHDLSGWIAQMGTVSGALDAHPQNLQSLITDFNTTAAAFARQNVNLQNAVGELPRTLNAATPAFNALNAAFPPLRALSRALLPGVQSTGPMVDASLPFITQLRYLVQKPELRGLTADLSPTIPALARLTQGTIPLMQNGVRPASSCAANVIYPWSQLTLNDPNFNASNGFPPRKAFIEAVDYLPGLAGESRDFDANGPYIRVLGTGGTFTYSLQPGLFGQSLAPITSLNPVPPTPHTSGDGATVAVQRPPLMESVPCETQPAITDLSSPAGPPPTQIATDLASPAAAARAQGAGQSAISYLGSVLKQQGMSLKVVGQLPTSAQLERKKK